MYVGRIVGVGRTPDGRPVSAYRVSSRSFPNRNAEQLGQSIQIVPRPGSPDAASASPYIAYECLLWNERFAVASNGTHTRPIFERLKAGHTPRDAMVSVLAGLDREYDGYDTPRLCGLFDRSTDTLWLGSVTATSLAVMPVEVGPGQMAYVTTYGFPLPLTGQTDPDFMAEDAKGACQHITGSSVFADFEKPICAAAAVPGREGIAVAILNVEVSRSG
jgi:IMP cyclohydrolase